MVHDFVDDNRPDARPRVGPAERVAGLRDEMFFANAREVTAKGYPVLRRAIAETMEITGQIGGRVTGKKIDLVAQ